MSPELVEMLARAGAPANARAEVEAGAAPVWVFERDTGSRQITVAGVVKLAAAPKRIADDFFGRDSLLEADVLTASGAFGDPVVDADVAGYRVPESDLEVLADCGIRACKFKLGAPALAQLEAIDWDDPNARRAVDALVRRRMVELMAAYRKEGRNSLGRYLDKPDGLSVTEATGMLLDQMKAKLLVDTVRAHLGGYPASRVPGARDRLHWNVRDYGYRPVTSILHTVVFEPGAGEPAALIASETLYSSHYFYARLQLLGLYADTRNSEQTYALYADRLLFDGEVGTIQRKLLRSGVVDDLRQQLGEVAASYHSR
jgi:hypothetical protein